MLALLRIWVEISLDFAASPCPSLALLRVWVEISLDLAASPWRGWLAAPCWIRTMRTRRNGCHDVSACAIEVVAGSTWVGETKKAAATST